MSVYIDPVEFDDGADDPEPVAGPATTGHEVEIAGDAVLHVSRTSFAYPFDAPVEPRGGPERIDEQRPYRVELLEDPTRLIIDLVTG